MSSGAGSLFNSSLGNSSIQQVMGFGSHSSGSSGMHTRSQSRGRTAETSMRAPTPGRGSGSASIRTGPILSAAASTAPTSPVSSPMGMATLQQQFELLLIQNHEQARQQRELLALLSSQQREVVHLRSQVQATTVEGSSRLSAPPGVAPVREHVDSVSSSVGAESGATRVDTRDREQATRQDAMLALLISQQHMVASLQNQVQALTVDMTSRLLAPPGNGPTTFTNVSMIVESPQMEYHGPVDATVGTLSVGGMPSGSRFDGTGFDFLRLGVFFQTKLLRVVLERASWTKRLAVWWRPNLMEIELATVSPVLWTLKPTRVISARVIMSITRWAWHLLPVKILFCRHSRLTWTSPGGEISPWMVMDFTNIHLMLM